MTIDQFKQLTAEALDYVAKLNPSNDQGDLDLELQSQLAALLAPKTGYDPSTILVLEAGLASRLHDKIASCPQTAMSVPSELKRWISDFVIFSISDAAVRSEILSCYSVSAQTLAILLLAIKANHITIASNQ